MAVKDIRMFATGRLTPRLTPRILLYLSYSPSTPTWAPDPAKSLAQHYMSVQEGNSGIGSPSSFIHALVPPPADLLALWCAGQIAACLDLRFPPCRCTCGFTCTLGECSLHGYTCWAARLRARCALAALAIAHGDRLPRFIIIVQTLDDVTLQPVVTIGAPFDAQWQALTAGTRHGKRGKQETDALWAELPITRNDYKSRTTK